MGQVQANRAALVAIASGRRRRKVAELLLSVADFGEMDAAAIDHAEVTVSTADGRCTTREIDLATVALARDLAALRDMRPRVPRPPAGEVA